MSVVAFGSRGTTMTRDERGDLIAHMDRAHFLAAVKRANVEAAEADHSRVVLVLWAARLLPYLDPDPTLSIAQAIEQYKAQHHSTS
jgi:hypothetical protein